jgi:hypothetical protein
LKLRREPAAMAEDEVRVLVTGDREWDDYFLLRCVCDGLLARYGERLVIVEGDAKGADRMAGDWAEKNGLTVENGRLRKYPANWTEHHKAAGPIRNREMLKEEEPHLVCAFHNNLWHGSKGTLDMVTIASKAKVPCYHFSTIRVFPQPELDIK